MTVFRQMVFAALLVGFSHAGVLLDEAFETDLLVEWSKAPGSVVRMREGAVRIENFNDSSLRRSFIYRNSGANGVGTIQGSAVYNFFHGINKL